MPVLSEAALACLGEGDSRPTPVMVALAGSGEGSPCQLSSAMAGEGKREKKEKIRKKIEKRKKENVHRPKYCRVNVSQVT